MKHWTLIESLLAIAIIGILWALVARADDAPYITFPPDYVEPYAYQVGVPGAPPELEEFVYERFLPGTILVLDGKRKGLERGICDGRLKVRVVYPDGRPPESWQPIPVRPGACE